MKLPFSIFIVCLLIKCLVHHIDGGQSASKALGIKQFEHIFANTEPTASKEVQAKAVDELIKRTVPKHAHLFKVNIDARLPLHTFHLYKSTADKIVRIKASSGVIACKAFNHYLKFYCNSHVSWDGYRIQMPDKLPDVNVTETSPSRFIYYQNVCSFSYSLTWWQWKDWQRHIDWIAMQGITLTLAPTQEKVWSDVYTELGLTKDEINDYFVGPSFAAWQRMAHINGFGGPLPGRFMLWSSSLQKQVISSFRNLGIAFALPAFAGYVPKALKRIYPNAEYVKCRGRWHDFPAQYSCPLLIESNDPLFKKVGKLFLTKIIKEYGGGNHIYFSDPFHEMNLPNMTVEYIAHASNMIYSTMKEVDKNAIWLLQSWFFRYPQWTEDAVEAFLTAVPRGRILVLDLNANHQPLWPVTKSFHGQPFIWCMLSNFGGRLGMQGNLEIVNQEIVNVKQFPNSSMVGVGITPEGINQNYIMYEFALDRSWYQDSTDIPKWIKQYTLNRYGIENEHIRNAWNILKDTVYTFKIESYPARYFYVVGSRPSMNITQWAWYNLTLIDDVLDEMLKTPLNLITGNKLFKYDLVDVTRQFLQNKIELLYPQMKTAFAAKDVIALKKIRHTFESMLIDLDDILQTDEHFFLGNWIESAKSIGANQQEKLLFEYNARTHITIWGPNGEISDYAHKQWAGIVRDYSLPRWQLFFSELEKSIEKKNGEFSDDMCKQKMFKQIEEPFTLAHKIYSTMANGDTIEISRKILQKWKGI
ncbi:alpha-N-acetylglucosaminidase-like [Contarinia nasturtii]|uniref:alpha-N-acetylglucosaminidase-like n=1 Tax=Contarinia nasturtii TaxID=265458 RepID=UPI0012D498D6|nr:alpha-N-acetylglucosaminidase-like [Contarinia nasturtii]